MSDRSGRRAGELVRAVRQTAGLTQRQLAEAAGVGVGVVRDLEQGRTLRPRGTSVRRLATALGLSEQQASELSRGMREHRPAQGAAQGRDGTAGLRIGVLGPLEAWRNEAPVALGPPMQRAVLGLLILAAGAGVSRSALIDALWGDEPPETATSMLQTYISRLRLLLRPDALVSTANGHGYRLEAAGRVQDLSRFGGLVLRAQQKQGAGELAAACQDYAAALALWRGEPLADCDVLRGHPAVGRLSQERDDAVLAYAEAAIAACCADRVLPQLRDLAGREPLNERVHALLMIALAACGQQAAGLAVFDQMRQRLDSQLGLRPGAELTAAQARVLSQQVPVSAGAGAAPEGARARGAEAGRPARQLPGVVAHFVGRAGELAALDSVLDQAAGQAIVISAIAGTAGVGKTALAVQWAHRVAGRFPDGQLYLNLRGYDPGQPRLASDALAQLLRALGVPGPDIPAEEDERSGRYRSLLAGKRMLIMLDNAGSADQVRPLLPGTPACTVVVTSRDALAGLVSRDGATRLELDRLPLADAVSLLQTLIGPRVDADPGAAAELATQCCRLPLALRVAAEFVTSCPGETLTTLTGELADLYQRLDLLAAGGDQQSAVRAVFSWSYQHLDATAARAFRLLGLHPGPDFEPQAVAALTGMTDPQARQVLFRLDRAHMLHVPAPGRYARHDLLRAYGRELAVACDGADQHAALSRLRDYYLGAAAAAVDVLYPAERHWRPQIPPSATPVPEFASPAEAQAWLDDELTTLVAMTGPDTGDPEPGFVIRLAGTLFRYLDGSCYHAEAIALHTRAHQAARQAGDVTAEAAALRVLGLIASHQGHYRQAADHLEQALALSRQSGRAQQGQANALTNLGIVSYLQGDYTRARDWWQQSLAVHRENGDQAGENSGLGNLGLLDLRQGRYQRAGELLSRSLDLARSTGNRTAEFTALANLGEVSLRQGAYQRATAQLQQALALSRQVNDRNHEATALVRLGAVSLRVGRHQEAADRLHQALALAREAGDREDEAEALNGLGDVLLGGGQPEQALPRHAEALELASQIGGKYQQARAHHGLAQAHQATGAPCQARHHWHHALRLYTALGTPEAASVRAELMSGGT